MTMIKSYLNGMVDEEDISGYVLNMEKGFDVDFILKTGAGIKWSFPTLEKRDIAVTEVDKALLVLGKSIIAIDEKETDSSFKVL